MASVVSRFGGLADADSYSVTLASTGSNRLIVAAVVYNCVSGQTLTAANINGTEAGEIVFSDISNGVAGIAIIVWNEADHPGAGSATINLTFSAAVSQRSHLVWELEDSTQQTAPYFNLTNTVFDGTTITGAERTVNVVDQSGVLGLAFIGARGGSFFDVTPASTANLSNDFETDNTNSHLYGADTASIADNDEDFGFTLTLTGGTAPTNGHLGLMAFEIADVTPPTFDTVPAIDTTTDQGHTIDFTLNEGGTVYGVRIAQGGSAPTPAQVKAGTDGADAAALEVKSVVVAAGVENSFTFSTASASTVYDYYIVAEDDADPVNLQAATSDLLNQTTLDPTIRISSTTPAQPISGEEFVIDLIQVTNATGKTVTFNGHTVTPSFQDINQIVIDSFPYPWDLATADSDFLTNYDLVVTDGANTDTVQRQFDVPTGAVYLTVQGSPYPESGIFNNDTGLVDGTKHYGEWLVGGQFAEVAANGVVTNFDNNSQYQYRFFDITNADPAQRLWGTAATATFTVGTPSAVSVSLSLVDIASSAQASLAGLRWAWYDSTDENALGTPTDTGVSETTTAAGLLEIDLPNSALVAGQTGTLIIGDATGRKAAYNLTVA